MKKLVNGHVVEISNIELFELAAEGEAIQKTALSSTSDGVDNNINSAKMQRYIEQYNIFFKSMPYPLYAIELDIKYATLANFIKHLNGNDTKMWINNGLFIVLDAESKMTLHIVNNTWGVVYVDEETDNTQMERFMGSTGFNEYNWLLERVIKRESTENFYNVFLPGVMDACKGNQMVLQWELQNMLTFADVPKKIKLTDNKILDLENEREYTLDTFVVKTVSTGEKDISINIASNNVKMSQQERKMKIYGCDVYTKSLSNEAYRFSDVPEKLIKTKEMQGMHNVFNIITAIKNAQNRKNFPVYSGFVLSNTIIFAVDKSLFVTKAHRIDDATEIARGIEIYGVNRNNVYFTKSKKITDKVTKEALYCYNLANKTIKLCSIKFKH